MGTPTRPHQLHWDEWPWVYHSILRCEEEPCNVVMELKTSLFSNLPCSETQALKLYRRGEPGVFSVMRTVEGNLIARGHTRRHRTWKWLKVAGNLLHTSSYTYLLGGQYMYHTMNVKRIVGWTTHKMLPFCSGPISIGSWSQGRLPHFLARTWVICPMTTP